MQPTRDKQTIWVKPSCFSPEFKTIRFSFKKKTGCKAPRRLSAFSFLRITAFRPSQAAQAAMPPTMLKNKRFDHKPLLSEPEVSGPVVKPFTSCSDSHGESRLQYST